MTPDDMLEAAQQLAATLRALPNRFDAAQPPRPSLAAAGEGQIKAATIAARGGPGSAQPELNSSSALLD